MSDTKRLGPTQTANVRLATKDEKGQPEIVFVGRGEELPANLADGEVERLEKAGAFAQPPKPVTVTVPEAAAALTSYLPPEVTLSANDADGNPPGLPVYPAPEPTAAPEATEGGERRTRRS